MNQGCDFVRSYETLMKRHICLLQVLEEVLPPEVAREVCVRFKDLSGVEIDEVEGI